MERRDAIARVALLIGGTLSVGTLATVLEGCKTGGGSKVGKEFAIVPQHREMIAEIAEMILPKTSTPGAKEASAKWHKREMLLICIIYAEFFVYNRINLEWQDWFIVISLGSALFTVFVNVISLNQKWNYVGKTSEFDKRYGKWLLITQFIALGISVLLKILIK